MRYWIMIDCESEDPHVLEDAIHTLELVMPYMMDNVVITSGTEEQMAEAMSAAILGKGEAWDKLTRKGGENE